MIEEQCITVSSRLSRQIEDYSSAGNEPDLAPDRHLRFRAGFYRYLFAGLLRRFRNLVQEPNRTDLCTHYAMPVNVTLRYRTRRFAHINLKRRTPISLHIVRARGFFERGSIIHSRAHLRKCRHCDAYIRNLNVAAFWPTLFSQPEI